MRSHVSLGSSDIESRVALKTAAAILAGLLWFTPTTFGAAPTFQGLGRYSNAYGISGDGSTIVGIAPSGKAGYWREGIGWQDFGIAGYARDASYDGSAIAGLTGISGQNISSDEAFLWTAAGGFTMLPEPSTHAYAISADGTTVVGSYGPYVFEQQPFMYTSGSGTVDLSHLGSLPSWAYATAVDADGSVIGGSGPGQGFIWTVGDTAVVPVSMAVQDLSADGAIAVGFRGTSNGSTVCIWTATGGLRDLPQFGAGGHFGHDITADGSIVTGYYTTSGQRALVWSSS